MPTRATIIRWSPDTRSESPDVYQQSQQRVGILARLTPQHNPKGNLGPRNLRMLWHAVKHMNWLDWLRGVGAGVETNGSSEESQARMKPAGVRHAWLCDQSPPLLDDRPMISMPRSSPHLGARGLRRHLGKHPAYHRKTWQRTHLQLSSFSEECNCRPKGSEG